MLHLGVAIIVAMHESAFSRHPFYIQNLSLLFVASCFNIDNLECIFYATQVDFSIKGAELLFDSEFYANILFIYLFIFAI